MKQLRHLFFKMTACLYVLLWVHSALAVKSFVMVTDRTLYGTTREVRANEKDTLLDIARDYDLGYNQIVAANPDIDPWLPPNEELVLVPSAVILPQERLNSGIVVNIAEMRLYYFFSTDTHEYFLTAPIGIGKEGFLTQLGVYTIKSKAVNPTWVVPESIKEIEPDLPDKVPPGQDNPLGDYVFRLSQMKYAIHGTNKPWGIGRRVSHGCIRMYPEDVSVFYPIVSVGTVVHVIYEPIKVGWGDEKCWIQVFDDFDNRIDDLYSVAVNKISQLEITVGPLDVDSKAISKAIKNKTGVPTAVAYRKNVNE
jgi:L,D-transpeptidase ErfK/SrfK